MSDEQRQQAIRRTVQCMTELSDRLPELVAMLDPEAAVQAVQYTGLPGGRGSSSGSPAPIQIGVLDLVAEIGSTAESWWKKAAGALRLGLVTGGTWGVLANRFPDVVAEDPDLAWDMTVDAHRLHRSAGLRLGLEIRNRHLRGDVCPECGCKARFLSFEDWVIVCAACTTRWPMTAAIFRYGSQAAQEEINASAG